MDQAHTRFVFLALGCLAASTLAWLLADLPGLLWGDGWDVSPMRPQWDDLADVLLGGGLMLGLGWAYRRRFYRADRALAGERARLRQLVDAMPHGLLELSADGTLLFANPAWLRMLGADHLPVGVPLWPMLAADAAVERLRVDLAAAAAGDRGVAELQLRRADDTGRTVRLDWTARAGEYGITMVAVATDVTELRHAGRRLQDIEQRYRALFYDNPDVVCLVDRDGRYVDMNEAALAFAGLSREQAIGMHVREVVLDEDMPGAWAEHEALLAGRPQRSQMRIQSGTGMLHMDSTRIPVVVDGEVVSVFAVAKDITAYVEAERRARRSEQHYRALFETFQDAVYTVDAEGRFTSANPACAKLLGVPREELIGLPFAPFVHPDELARGYEYHRRTLQGEPQHLSMHLLRADGSDFWADVSASPLLVDGVVEGMMGITSDATARVTAERQLRESERRYRSLFDQSLEGILLLDATGTVMAANPAASRILPLPVETIVGRSVRAFFDLDNPRCVELRAGLRTQGHGRAELLCEGANCRYTAVDVSAVGFEADDGQRQICVMFRDVSERRAAEAQLAALREELRRLSSFLQTVQEAERRHIARELHDEFGQCLTAIKLDTRWIRGRLSPECEAVVGDKLQTIDRTVDTAVASVRRLAANLRPTILDDLGLVAACEWLLQDFKQHAAIECHLSVEPDEFELPAEIATASFRVVQEALTNVARHAGASRVDVRLQRAEGLLSVMIADDGVGIDAATVDGGFGLVGMRERVQALDGSLVIDSAAGEGTRIVARFPLPAEGGR